jgi:ABC-type antimicrobial peptide transport system permease subunit
MILRESVIVAAVGLGIGLPLSFIVARTLRCTLYGLTPEDPLTFALAFLSIIGVSLGASYIPARQAASVDPLISLRTE